jgi:hypothetical protein
MNSPFWSDILVFRAIYAKSKKARRMPESPQRQDCAILQAYFQSVWAAGTKAAAPVGDIIQKKPRLTRPDSLWWVSEWEQIDASQTK